ncbi:hypothetical protein RF55_17116, partial [Lasius niger]
YIYKGHDAATITIEPITENAVIDHDEIRDYIEARYVGPVEASWRILDKKLQDKSHSIMRLPVHLPNEQNVIIENKSIEDAVTSTSNTNRIISFTIIVNLTVEGATSFDDLRTVSGEIYQSFSETCLALGLIEDDDEWKRAMNEAVEWMMPRQLRKLFVHILLHCQPLHPEELWESFKVALSEDYTRHFDILQGQKKAYEQIGAMLLAEGKSFTDFPQMEQIIENNEEKYYVTLEQAELKNWN